jgi:catechol 2,3-dioxygenase-like lactoylglutathione lyase family enzyme
LVLVLGALALAAELVEGVDSVGITVSDLDRAVDFYSNVLKFERVSAAEVHGDAYERLEGVFGMRMRVARLRLGQEHIELREFLAPRGRPVPVDFKSNDRWFQHIAIVVSDMGEAYARLRRYRVEHASTGPQTLPAWNPNAGGIQAFYFRDPDGHHLEVIWYPRGKGDARWQARDGRLFLGIDHTAIVVADTEASLKFYRDTLGLKVAGGSENHGVEQERLNNVFGARLRITSLKGASGPGIEFLEYLAPRTGRPFPADAQSNDLVQWQTKLRATNVASSEEVLRARQAVFVSSGAVTLPDVDLGFDKGLVVRDPDGHALALAEVIRGAAATSPAAR